MSRTPPREDLYSRKIKLEIKLEEFKAKLFDHFNLSSGNGNKMNCCTTADQDLKIHVHSCSPVGATEL